MFGEYITIPEALFITVISITIVFCILLLIAFAIMSFKYIFKEKEIKPYNNKEVSKNLNETNIQKQIVNLDEIEKDENKLVAIMVATIDANKNEEDKKYKVVNIREL